MLLRDLLVERGVVMRGESVIVTSVARHGACKLIAGHARSAAEHHVLEEVRQTGIARRVVGGSNPEPQHLGDDWRAVIGTTTTARPF